MEGEVVGRRIKPTESTTVAKLSVGDQLRLLISKLNNDDVAELEASEKVSAIELSMKSSLQKLFSTAAKCIDSGENESVTLKVSSKYIPYLDDVIDKRRGMGRFYNFEVTKKDLPVNIDFTFIVKIERKVENETKGKKTS